MPFKLSISSKKIYMSDKDKTKIYKYIIHFLRILLVKLYEYIFFVVVNVKMPHPLFVNEKQP